jgi:KipI family sensor histidine kinase inhibitor
MNSGPLQKTKFRHAGDCGLLVEYGDTIDLAVHQKIRSMVHILKMTPLPGVREVIPAYRSILVRYDPLRIKPSELETHLIMLGDKIEFTCFPRPRTIDIPVCYGGEFGPDLADVAEHNALSVEDVIQIHTEAVYLIYMVGFSPGFPFLGGLSERLHTPRLETPRTSVPAGSVGIANNQTGIYPLNSPGGWRLIGRTPLRLFAPEKKDPFLYQPGDHLKFRSISAQEYQKLAQGAVQ